VALDYAADLDTMFNTDELAESAIYTRAGYASTSIPVIFENEFSVTEESAEVDMGLPAPQARCKTADAVNAARGDTLQIGAVTYHVQEAQPNGKGVTLLILSRDA
jgi:hypothetical protein